jgi:hypothetical protein
MLAIVTGTIRAKNGGGGDIGLAVPAGEKVGRDASHSVHMVVAPMAACPAR